MGSMTLTLTSESAGMFFILATSVVFASVTGLLMSGFGALLVLASIPLGASLGAALAGGIVALQTHRRYKAACDTRHVGESVADGLRSVLAGAIREPLPQRFTELAGRLSGPAGGTKTV